MYEEQSINGVIMFRTKSGGEWLPLSHCQLSKKLVERDRENKLLTLKLSVAKCRLRMVGME